MIPALFDALHADPWAREFVDLPTLNARASGAVEEAIERLRREAAAGGRELRSASLVILGPPGAGKTHLFARLRRRVGARAVFVHVRPLVHAEMTTRFVLGEVVRQLSFSTPQGLPQASAMVGSLLGALSGLGSAFPSAALTLYGKLSAAEREARLEAALERVLSLWPEADEVYLGRLLHLPFNTGPTGRALLAWLSGRDCDAAQLERIGAAASIGEERALPALQTLCVVGALGAPLVLVFDQLENLMDSDGAGPRLRAYAHLASECVDVLRGTVLVHLALDSEWERGIEPSFNASQRSRIVMRRELLGLPRAAEREELLRLLFERVPERQHAFPWPLGEQRLERLKAQPGITPRLLLAAFRRALEGESEEGDTTAQTAAEPGQVRQNAVGQLFPDEPTAEPPGAAPSGGVSAAEGVGPPDLASEWQAQLTAARLAVHAASEAREPLDPARLADGLLSAGRFLPGLRLAATGKPPVTLVLEAAARREQVALVQESNHKSVAATLGKLIQLTQAAPVLAIRERARELPPTWRDTRSKQSALLETGRARWLDLDAEDGARLLALDALLQSARSGDVTEARGAQVSEGEVAEWVAQRLEVPSWPVCSALCSGEALVDGEAATGAAPGADERRRTEESARAPLAVPVPPWGGGATLAVLRRLRVASLDRLLREVSRVEPKSSRASVLAELAAARDRVRWFGRAIVCLKGEP